MPVGAAGGRDAAPTRTIADMLPLIPADLLRALGLILVPVAAVHAGWPSAAAMLLVFGSQWLTRWLAPGGVLDWAAQAVLLLAGWLSVIGLYPRVPWLDLLVHAAASAVVSVLWFIAGYSLSFGAGPAAVDGFVGGLQAAFLNCRH